MNTVFPVFVLPAITKELGFFNFTRLSSHHQDISAMSWGPSESSAVSLCQGGVCIVVRVFLGVQCPPANEINCIVHEHASDRSTYLHIDIYVNAHSTRFQNMSQNVNIPPGGSPVAIRYRTVSRCQNTLGEHHLVALVFLTIGQMPGMLVPHDLLIDRQCDHFTRTVLGHSLQHFEIQLLTVFVV